LFAAFANRLSLAQEKYQQLVTEGKNQPSPWEQLRNQVFLGSEAFVSDLHYKIERDKDISEIPKSQRRAKAKSLDYYTRQATNRNEAILASYNSGGYSMKEIGDYYGLHYSWISRVISHDRKASNKT